MNRLLDKHRFDMRSTYTTIIKSTLADLVVGIHVIFDNNYIENWDTITHRKHAMFDKNKRR